VTPIIDVTDVTRTFGSGGGLDAPDSGAVRIDGKDVTSMREQQRVHLRRETVAYIFQSAPPGSRRGR
jgi:ABC-type lipoprotein export system ATPase subunit